MKSYRTVVPHPDSIYDIALSPDESTLASACRDGNLRLWSWPKADLEYEVEVGSSLTCVRFSPDGSLVAAGSADGVAVVSSPPGSGEGLMLRAGSVESLAFAPGGDRLVAAAADGFLSEWSLPYGDQLRGQRFGNQALSSIEFVADGRSIVIGSAEACIWHVDAATWKGERLQLGPPGTSRVYRATCSQDGDLCAASIQFDQSGEIGATLTPHLFEISVWRRSDRTGPNPNRSLVGHAGWIGALAFDTRGHLASGSFDETVKVWDAEVRQLVAQSREHEGAVYSVTFTRSGRLLSASADGTVKVWDPPFEAPPSEITRDVPDLTPEWLALAILEAYGPGRSPIVRVAQDIVDAILALGSRKRMEDAISRVLAGPMGKDRVAIGHIGLAVAWIIQLRLEQAYRSGDKSTATFYNQLGEVVREAWLGA